MIFRLRARTLAGCTDARRGPHACSAGVVGAARRPRGAAAPAVPLHEQIYAKDTLVLHQQLRARPDPIAAALAQLRRGALSPRALVDDWSAHQRTRTCSPPGADGAARSAGFAGGDASAGAAVALERALCAPGAQRQGGAGALPARALTRPRHHARAFTLPPAGEWARVCAPEDARATDALAAAEAARAAAMPDAAHGRSLTRERQGRPLAVARATNGHAAGALLSSAGDAELQSAAVATRRAGTVGAPATPERPPRDEPGEPVSVIADTLVALQRRGSSAPATGTRVRFALDAPDVRC